MTSKTVKAEDEACQKTIEFESLRCAVESCFLGKALFLLAFRENRWKMLFVHIEADLVDFTSALIFYKLRRS